MSLITLRPLLDRIEQQLGHEKIDEIAAAADIDGSRLRSLEGRATAEQIATILDRARVVFPDPAELRRSIGPRTESARLGLARRWLSRVDWAYARLPAAAEEHFPVGTLVVEREGPGHHLATWEPAQTPAAQSLCPLVGGWLEAVPLWWGLPRAQLSERRCVRHGDPRCEYELHHCVNPTALGALAGLVAGALLGALATQGWSIGALSWVLLCIGGAALGHAIESERVGRLNVRTARATQRALTNLAHLEAEARREIGALEQRQHEWTNLLEQELAARTEALERITEQINVVQRKRKAKLQGFTHDVRNPLAAIRMTTDFLQEQLSGADVDLVQAVEDLALASQHMEELLGHLLRTAASDSAIALRAPVHLPVPTLVRTLRARLRGLVHGRSIETDVALGPNAPPELRVDPLRFDRILDNLITNAAKYTEGGSITITLDGAPSELVVRVSDTGRGMSAEQLQRVFFGRDFTASRSSAGGGWGFGLAVVVRLLAELGGQLHVESVEKRGSTFEVRLPLAPRASKVGAASANIPTATADHDHAAERAPGRVATETPERLGAQERARGATFAGQTGSREGSTEEPFDAVWRRVVQVRPAPPLAAQV